MCVVKSRPFPLTMLKCIARDSLPLFYPPSWEVERESKYGLTDSAADNDGETRGGSLGCSAPWLGIDRREDGKQKRGKRNDKKTGLKQRGKGRNKKGESSSLPSPFSRLYPFLSLVSTDF